jgi:aspartate kinase
MSVVVLKFGGSSVADVERIGKVADRVAERHRSGTGVVVVVSAMGHTTDELLALARQVCESPARRELDMLLSAGERISMALLSMALNARGVPAVSFTGSQSGIITTDDHTNARIVEVRPLRVHEELERGKVVIVAGYQGVSPRKEVTTLGRGGSDTTAVAMAAALGAEACEIYSDVEGVFSADPRVVPDAHRLAEISYEEMQELAEAGAKVLNAQAVEFAKERGIRIHARSTFGGTGETVVHAGAPARVAGVTSESGLALLSGPVALLGDLLELLDRRKVRGKQLRSEGDALSLAVSLEDAHGFVEVEREIEARFGGRVRVARGVGAVSAIGAGINASFDNVRTVLGALAGVEVLGVSTSSFRISVLVPEARLAEAVRAVHAKLVG